MVNSSDGIKFKLHRIILQIASSVWRDLFDTPQPADNGEARDLPMIEISEPSNTLPHLFRLIYPIEKQQIMEFDVALQLVEAYDKYVIDLSSLVPYLADLLSGSSIQAKPVEAYGLTWRLKKGDAVATASRYLHQVALDSRESKDQILLYAGDFNSLLALHDLRHRRELALDRFMTTLPISLYRCPQHANLTALEAQRLRVNARKALGTASPHCSDVVQFLGLKEVFYYNTSTSTTGQSAIILPASTLPSNGILSRFPNPSVQVARTPQPNQMPSPSTCSSCDSAFSSLKFASGCALVNSAISIFPHAVKW